MKTFSVVGKSEESALFMRKHAEKHGFVFVEKSPDFVISYGGDGMFLIAERIFPGVPKVLLRDSKICNKCHNLPTEEVLKLLAEGKFRIEDSTKLGAELRNTSEVLKYECANDFVLRNKWPIHAIRFEVYVNDKKIGKTGEEFIGDGLVIATSFGSGGYHNSITRKTFSKGIGIAFNNMTKETPHLVVEENSEIKLKLMRGDFMFVADNNPKIFEPEEGTEIIIKRSSQSAKLLWVER